MEKHWPTQVYSNICTCLLMSNVRRVVVFGLFVFCFVFLPSVHVYIISAPICVEGKKLPHPFRWINFHTPLF